MSSAVRSVASAARARVRRAWAWGFGKISAASPAIGSHLVLQSTWVRHPYVTRKDDQTRRIIREVLALEPMQDVQLSGTGKLMLLSRTRVYFVALGDVSDAAIQKSIRSWEGIRSSTLADVVSGDWRQLDIAGASVLSTERLETCRDPHRFGRSILRRLRAEGEYATPPQSSVDAWFRAAPLLTDHDSARHWQGLTLEIAHHPWRLGPTHGDLTPPNIMKGTADECVLIDLDRFAWDGIQLFDALHFAVESYCKTHRTDWIAFLETEAFCELAEKAAAVHGSTANTMEGTNSRRMLTTLYTLERVRHELRYPVSMMPPSWVQRVGRLLSMIAGGRNEADR